MAASASFTSIAQATAPRPAGQDEHDLLLEQVRPLRGTQGELVARKQYMRIKDAVLQQSDHLRALVAEAPKTGDALLRVTVDAEGMSVESIARALEWQAATPRERSQLVQHFSWQYVSSLMHAASWLGSASLVTACEAKLCRQLRLENVCAHPPAHRPGSSAITEPRAIPLETTAAAAAAGMLLHLTRASECYPYPDRNRHREHPTPTVSRPCSSLVPPSAALRLGCSQRPSSCSRPTSVLAS